MRSGDGCLGSMFGSVIGLGVGLSLPAAALGAVGWLVMSSGWHDSEYALFLDLIWHGTGAILAVGGGIGLAVGTALIGAGLGMLALMSLAES